MGVSASKFARSLPPNSPLSSHQSSQLTTSLLRHADETFFAGVVQGVAERRVVVSKEPIFLSCSFHAPPSLHGELEQLGKLVLGRLAVEVNDLRRALQSSKSSFSDKRAKVSLCRRNKFRAFDHNAQFKVAIKCVVRKIGTGNQRKLVDNSNLGVELSWTTRQVSFSHFNRPVIDLARLDKGRGKGHHCVVAKLPF